MAKQGNESDLFLPTNPNVESELMSSFKVVLYNLMRNDSFRRALRDWAFGNIADNNTNLAYIEAYSKLCGKFGTWSTADEAIQRRYASTFEWYVSELLCREFSARASGFGLRLKDADPDDEFDCVALLDEGLVFVECKTGREAIFAQIKKFLRRDAELNAAYSFFVFDRDYTFTRDGDDVPKLSYAEARELGFESISKITVGSHTFFQILGPREVRGARYFLACSAFNGFEERIRYMIRYTNESRQSCFASSLFKFESIPFVSYAVNNPPSQPGQADTTAEPNEPIVNTGLAIPEQS